MTEAILVKVALDTPDNTHYGVKVASFEKVKEIPAGGIVRSGFEYAISVSDEEWANPDIDSSDDMKYVVMADSIVDFEDDTIYLEFDKDSYGKFVFLFGKENGAYFRVE